MQTSYRIKENVKQNKIIEINIASFRQYVYV